MKGATDRTTLPDDLISYFDENGNVRIGVFEPLPLNGDTIKRPERDQLPVLNYLLPAGCISDIELVSKAFCSDVLRGSTASTAIVLHASAAQSKEQSAFDAVKGAVRAAMTTFTDHQSAVQIKENDFSDPLKKLSSQQANCASAGNGELKESIGTFIQNLASSKRFLKTHRDYSKYKDKVGKLIDMAAALNVTVELK